jgi:hypothetical protein
MTALLHTGNHFSGSVLVVNLLRQADLEYRPTPENPSIADVSHYN